MAKTKIGGQAIFEGVMMRGEKNIALAVRDQKGDILLETERLPERKGAAKIPFIRGVVNLIGTFSGGMRYITRSAEIWGADGETEEQVSEKSMKAATAVGAVLGILAAVLLFIFVPDFLTRVIFNLSWGRVDFSGFSEFFSTLTSNDLIESSAGMLILGNIAKGIFKIAIFILYLVCVRRIKEVKRVFMYHGAEHRTINCFEKELELTVENVQKCSSYHDRCGTAFLIYVIIISIIINAVIEVFLPGFYALLGNNALKTLVRLIIRLMCLIPVAAVSYEFLMFNSRHEWLILKPLKALGRGMQRLTTATPEDSMAEVAIVSFKTVLEMEKDPDIPLMKFTTVGELKKEAAEKGVSEMAAAEWLICEKTGIKRNALDDKSYISANALPGIKEGLLRLEAGEPLQYILGDQQFFEYRFKVGKGVLIPRPETEELTVRALELAEADSRFLDMCAGSGCIGITVALKKGCETVLAEKSEEALKYCRLNARELGAKVEIVKSDMFSAVQGRFDIIACNPPYIPTEKLGTLDKCVRDYEPLSALDGGSDGLDYYRVLAHEAFSFLKPEGVLLMEIGEDQGESVKEIFAGRSVKIIKDMEGKDRIAEVSAGESDV